MRIMNISVLNVLPLLATSILVLFASFKVLYENIPLSQL